jgi:hypothetical protein
LPEIFLIVSGSRGALFPGVDSSAMNGSKKRPRVEKISSSRYRAYQGIRELIQGMRELIQATVAHVDAVATRSHSRLVHFLEQPGGSASFSRKK